MTKAYKCDICSNFFEATSYEKSKGQAYNKIYITTNSAMSDGILNKKDYDICSTCKDAIETYILSLKK